MKHLNMENGFYFKNMRGLVCCSMSANDPSPLSKTETQNAKVIYSLAPAMGHTQVLQTALYFV